MIGDTVCLLELHNLTLFHIDCSFLYRSVAIPATDIIYEEDRSACKASRSKVFLFLDPFGRPRFAMPQILRRL